MKNFLAVLLLMCVAISVCSCEKQIPRVNFTQERICSADEVKPLTDFVLQCAKNANPMRDEEGEDLVSECLKTGKEIICPLRPAFIFCPGSGRYGCATVPCSQAETTEEKQTCATRQRVYIQTQPQDQQL